MYKELFKCSVVPVVNIWKTSLPFDVLFITMFITVQFTPIPFPCSHKLGGMFMMLLIVLLSLGWYGVLV